MATEAFSDFVVGHGELWCALLFCAACRVQAGDAAFMDTREVLVVSRARGLGCSRCRVHHLLWVPAKCWW